MTYHITGLISAVIFLLTVSGLWLQLQLVWKRKQAFMAGACERPTAVLSLNQVVSSFLAFYSFFLYGGCLPRFNHYLVWTRLVASLPFLAPPPGGRRRSWIASGSPPPHVGGYDVHG